MAVSKILSIKDLPGEEHGKHLKAAFEYIRKKEKTQEGRLIGAVNCLPDYAYSQMMQTKKNYGKLEGRQAYHLIISFNEGEIEPDTAMEFMQKFVEAYLGKNYEAVYSVHDDTEHIHGHILFNSVSFKTGNKFHYKKGDWKKEIQPLVNRLCEEYGLKTLEPEQESKQEKYREWNERKDGKFVWGKMIRRDVDACILQSDTFDEFLQMMTDKGYEIKYGKHVAVKLPGMERVRRLYKLGENYSEERIRERIEEETIGNFKREPVTSQPRIVGIRYRRFKRAKLTGLQKKYFARLYRLGKIKKHPYPKAWQYRADIRKMHKLQEQYLFLVKYQIHTKEELFLAHEKLSELRKASANEKSGAFKERSRFKGLFDQFESLEELRECEECFKNGDDFFIEEHDKYVAITEEISRQGYTLEEVEKLRTHMREKLREVSIKDKEIFKAFRLAESIIKEISEEEQKEKNIGNEISKMELEKEKREKDFSEQPPIR